MQHPLLSLRGSLSNERIEGYRTSAGDDDLILFTRYAWNIALSEALYPVLYGLEVALRNNLHTTVAHDTHNPLWLDSTPSLLRIEEVNKVQLAKQELIKAHKPIEPGRLVAELNFGFWTSLLNARYEGVFWPRLLQKAFPGMPKSIRKRKTLSTRFNNIRQLRNRIFHHEPIWRYPDLGQRHSELLETIYWLNPELREAIQLFDRFPEVYRTGLTSAQQLLETFLKGRGYS